MDYTEYNFTYDPAHRDFWFALFSDLHADARGFARALFLRDADAAHARGARFLFNGDIFDAILPTDRKRYSRADDTCSEDAQVNARVDMVYELLTPYVNDIDFIGLGNHEVSAVKYNSVDLIKLLVDRLNAVRDSGLAPIQRGGYQGFLRFWFRAANGSHTHQFVLYREHGKGGASPVTHGVINFSRIFTTFLADCYWLGHVHASVVDTTGWTIAPDRAGTIRKTRKLAVITAGYNEGFVQRNLPRGCAYQSSFPEEKFLVPTGLGSALLHITVPRGNNEDLTTELVTQ